MVINTNPAAARGARFLADATDNLQKSLARLSSGTKIVDPQDDAAGMAVSSRMDAQINRTQATRSNIGNAISLKQTQDGYLSKVGKALDRMSELATLAQDQTKTGTDLSLYNKEYETLYSYIDNIDDQLFNGVSLFQGAAVSAGIKVLIDDAGSSTSSYFTTAGIALSVSVTSSLSAGSSTSLSAVLTTAASSAAALETVKSAITQVAAFRASIGSDLSRLMSTDSHLSVLSENLSASLSRIKDVDVADESAKYAKYNILVQSGTAMLAQANSLPQSALRLLS